MPKARQNQHRWKSWVDLPQLQILEGAGKALRRAWKWDKRYPKSYPVNTDWALWETRLELRQKPVEPKTTELSRFRRPKSIHDFINEGVLQRLYEQQHSGSYRDALRRASEGFGDGFRAWRQIVSCLPAVYLLDFAGQDALPKPRVNFLHRELLEIAELLELDQPEGLAEFLDDVCPCGKKHNAEAIRKLKKRVSTAGRH